MPRFDRDTLDLLEREKEVRIETMRPDGSIRRTIIWVLVDQEEVFVRSWKGDRGYWYQAALDAPAAVALTVGEMRLPVTAVLADDPESVERCTQALQRKYKGRASTLSMIRRRSSTPTSRATSRMRCSSSNRSCPGWVRLARTRTTSSKLDGSAAIARIISAMPLAGP